MERQFSFPSRSKVWQQLETTAEWDLVVVGGGITGGGIFHAAARRGLRVLLIEQRDFAWGTSSRSSKLVHGGLRYLKEGKIGLTWASVREREKLLADVPGLVEPLGFLLAAYKDDYKTRFLYKLGLQVYDWMGGGQGGHASYSAERVQALAPHLDRDGLHGGYGYYDAQTDDARLTLRVITAGCTAGGWALNYASAGGVQRTDGRVTGVRVRDEETGRERDVAAQVVVNATGAWADRLRAEVGGENRIRPLRGSHLVLPAWRFPLAQAVSFLHPHDGRPVFAFPWEGVSLVGTTDVDHEHDLDEEPAITPAEADYLLTAVQHYFPPLDLKMEDVMATFAGVRPVVGSGKADPSQESRDHVVWAENGLLTVTGGKLTTFRVVADEALTAVRGLGTFDRLHESTAETESVFDDGRVALPPAADHLRSAERRRLIGRYGPAATAVVAGAAADELRPIGKTNTLWAELRWAARAEAVVHLTDLLLRRTRLGLLLPRGGLDLITEIEDVCRPVLGWDRERWTAEVDAYTAVWERSYGVPTAENIRGNDRADAPL